MKTNSMIQDPLISLQKNINTGTTYFYSIIINIAAPYIILQIGKENT